MPALRFVAAQIMKMPIRYANAVHIPRAPDGDHIAAGVFKAKFVPAFRRLRKHRVGLPAAVPALRMHSLENAAGLDPQGGHVLDLSAERLHLKINRIGRFDLLLPQTTEFAHCELREGKSAAAERFAACQATADKLL